MNQEQKRTILKTKTFLTVMKAKRTTEMEITQKKIMKIMIKVKKILEQILKKMREAKN